MYMIIMDHDKILCEIVTGLYCHFLDNALGNRLFDKAITVETANHSQRGCAIYVQTKDTSIKLRVACLVRGITDREQRGRLRGWHKECKIRN